MLEVRDLNVYYGKSHAVQGVNLTVEPGEVVALLGRNGAGKTTTCNGIMGMLPGASGLVVVDGVDVSAAMSNRRARAGIAYVPQGRLLFDGLTIEENLRAVWRGDTALWDEMLELFPRIRERLAQRAGTLSGGEQQMVAIARALLQDPLYVLLDEPTTGLSPAVNDRLLEAMRNWRGRGLGLVLIEEQLTFAADASDRVLVMDVGRIVHEGPIADLDDQELLQRHLGVAI